MNDSQREKIWVVVDELVRDGVTWDDFVNEAKEGFIESHRDQINELQRNQTR